MKKQQYIILGIVIFLIIIFIYKYLKNRKKMELGNLKVIPIGKANYIAFMTPIAKVIEKETGVPYKFIVAQTGLETGWGKSSLLQKSFNFGGIKAKAGEPYDEQMTHETLNSKDVIISQKFWKGKDVLEGLRKYIKILQLPRYSEAFKHTDALSFATEIKKGGYATDPSYVSKIASVLPSIA